MAEALQAVGAHHLARLLAAVATVLQAAHRPAVRLVVAIGLPAHRLPGLPAVGVLLAVRLRAVRLPALQVVLPVTVLPVDRHPARLPVTVLPVDRHPARLPVTVLPVDRHPARLPVTVLPVRLLVEVSLPATLRRAAPLLVTVLPPVLPVAATARPVNNLRPAATARPVNNLRPAVATATDLRAAVRPVGAVRPAASIPLARHRPVAARAGAPPMRSASAGTP